jgi:hypothetical protein
MSTGHDNEHIDSSLSQEGTMVPREVAETSRPEIPKGPQTPKKTRLESLPLSETVTSNETKPKITRVLSETVTSNETKPKITRVLSETVTSNEAKPKITRVLSETVTSNEAKPKIARVLIDTATSMANQKIIRVLTWVVSFFALAGLAIQVFFPTNIYLFMNIVPGLSYGAHGTSGADSTSTFYGENIDMSQILPASQHYVVNSKGQDLIDIAADLGINLIRITNAVRSFNNDADSVYTADQWNQVLRKMQSKGIKALILIETASNNGGNYSGTLESTASPVRAVEAFCIRA